jgi:hypothetical protein
MSLFAERQGSFLAMIGNFPFYKKNAQKAVARGKCERRLRGFQR